MSCFILTKNENNDEILELKKLIKDYTVVKSIYNLEDKIFQRSDILIIIFKYSDSEMEIQKIIDFLHKKHYKGLLLIGDSVFYKIVNYLPSSMYKKIGKKKFYPITSLLDYDNYRKSDRIFDFVFSCLILFVTLPLFIIVSVLIKITSRGPIFYISKRIGKKGKAFKFFKFRSLKVVSEKEEEKRKQQIKILLKRNAKKVSKVIDKQRLTPIGIFLRKTAIDELPQFINVLKGDMSIVGPRPCLPYEWDNYSDWQKRRMDIMPGCTGVWQIYGKGKTSFDEMIAMDLYFGYNRSLFLKLKLILDTLKVMLLLKGDL